MLEFTRLLSQADKAPYDTVPWTQTDIKITTHDGSRTIYECNNAEFPADWSDLAQRTTASKYFRESRNTDERETSVKVMIERVVQTIANAGFLSGYFDEHHCKVFGDELRMVLLTQVASFNSPVWFNLGVPGVEQPQVSACFINEVNDSMDSIMDLAKIEGLIYKEGSGSGTNFSRLRGSEEHIRGGGTASGPVSFMQGYDAFAGVILSGGRTRRAARMCILDADHPDILQFINTKTEQEKIVAVLVEAGFPSDFTSPNSAYNLVRHQSGNNSVRVTDDFMSKVRAVLRGYEPDSNWELKYRASDDEPKTVTYQQLFRAIATGAWACGDPGIQFDTTINRMNTCTAAGRIEASNPCGEFMWHNNSACNLASINLDKFATNDRTFDVKTFKHVVRLMLVAQDILVDLGGYPTNKIRLNSHNYRPLGLGYTNLGGLLMSWGIPYDSLEGQKLAASITSLMTAQAYLTSADMAEALGAFDAYEANKESMENVLDRHYSETRKLDKDIAGISTKAASVWQDALGKGLGRRKTQDVGVGYRNSQVTLLAPTGTISWLMDCATTGIEPDVALRKTKIMVGGNKVTYVNPNIDKALIHLGYQDKEIRKLLAYVAAHGHFEGSDLDPEHLKVFDCAVAMIPGGRCISVEGHLMMLAAVQPFLSGAISKTVNMNNSATVEDVERVFLLAWELGLKGITIYRDGSKMSEPLRLHEIQEKKKKHNIPTRRSLPDDLEFSPRHKFSVSGHEGYVHVGLDPETKDPVEVFVRVAKFGSTVGGLLDNYFILFSKALQYNIPIEELTSHMVGSKFPPAGFTTNPKIRSAGSIMDYLAQYLQMRWSKTDVKALPDKLDMPSIVPAPADDVYLMEDISGDICPSCGSLMHKSGTCSYCTNCPYSSGVCG